MLNQEERIDNLYHRTLREYARSLKRQYAVIIWDRTMAKFMRPETALARLAEDEHAPIRARVQALQQLTHPPLRMLRRLLAETSKRAKPVPSKVRALAALKYAQETQYRKPTQGESVGAATWNPLGII